MQKRLLVLNSYSLTERRAEEHVRVRCFFEGLAEGGYRRSYDVDVEMVDTNSMRELEERTREAARRPLDLIHAVGTPNAIVGAQFGGGAPVVYYGAHPEGVGEAACREAGVAGMVLTLPFTKSYKHFRLIRTLFPDVRQVFVPFYEDIVFCRPEMRSNHRRHRADNPGGSPWIRGDSPLIGFRGLAGLCDVIGVEYREFAYRDLDDLRMGLDHVGAGGTLIMPYNDSVYCSGAPQAIAEHTTRRGIPLFWNNNTEATRIGAVAALSSCFREAGLATGRVAARILDGAAPRDLPLLSSTKTYSSLNLGRARELGLDIAPQVVARFDEVL
jgi:putative ABC transport system substrate-binding protein